MFYYLENVIREKKWQARKYIRNSQARRKNLYTFSNWKNFILNVYSSIRDIFVKVKIEITSRGWCKFDALPKEGRWYCLMHGTGNISPSSSPLFHLGLDAWIEQTTDRSFKLRMVIQRDFEKFRGSSVENSFPLNLIRWMVISVRDTFPRLD